MSISVLLRWIIVEREREGQMRNDRQLKKKGRCQVAPNKNEGVVSAYRFIGVIFFIKVVGTDCNLWQELGYLGQARHLVFVFHAVKRQK